MGPTESGTNYIKYHVLSKNSHKLPLATVHTCLCHPFNGPQPLPITVMLDLTLNKQRYPILSK